MFYIFKSKKGEVFAKVLFDYDCPMITQAEVSELDKWGFFKLAYAENLFKFKGDIFTLLAIAELDNRDYTIHKDIYQFLLDNAEELCEGREHRSALRLKGRLNKAVGNKKIAENLFRQAFDIELSLFLEQEEKKEQLAKEQRQKYYEDNLKQLDSYLSLCCYINDTNLTKVSSLIEEFGSQKQKELIKYIKRENRCLQREFYAIYGMKI